MANTCSPRSFSRSSHWRQPRSSSGASRRAPRAPTGRRRSTVKAYDTLWTIARRTTAATCATRSGGSSSANHLAGSEIAPGEKLVLPCSPLQARGDTIARWTSTSSSSARPRARPRRGAAPSSLLVRRGGDRLLFDCGEGTQRQLLRSSIGLVDLEEVFLTHFHADHYLGLPGMLKTFSLRMRDVPLTVYGPPGLRDLFGALARDRRRGSPTALELVELRQGDALTRDGYQVCVFPVSHGVPAVGYALVEAERPGRFDDAARGRARRPVRARARRAPARRGGHARRRARREPRGARRPDDGRAGRSSTRATPRRPRPSPLLFPGADLLIHEATFGDDDVERALETGHSTARAGGRGRARRRRVAARAHPRLAALLGPELLQRGTRGLPGQPSCRATSTSSRCRSASAASRRSSRAEPGPQRTGRGDARHVTTGFDGARRPLRGAAPGRRELVGGLRGARPARRPPGKPGARGRLRHRPARAGARGARAGAGLGGRRVRGHGRAGKGARRQRPGRARRGAAVQGRLVRRGGDADGRCTSSTGRARSPRPRVSLHSGGRLAIATEDPASFERRLVHAVLPVRARDRAARASRAAKRSRAELAPPGFETVEIEPLRQHRELTREQGARHHPLEGLLDLRSPRPPRSTRRASRVPRPSCPSASSHQFDWLLAGGVR